MQGGMLDSVYAAGKARTNHAHVAESLGKAIVSGDYPEGTILPGDQELVAQFKVSRTVLREAMKTLAAKGLVTPRARIGTRVNPASKWNLFDPAILSWTIQSGVDERFLHHLTQMRLAFEPHAAGLAAEQADRAQIARLGELVDDMANPRHTPESLALADLRFHIGVMEASGNPFMRTVANLVEAALVSMFKLSAPLQKGIRPADVADQHRAIVKAIADGDGEAARKAMAAVIRSGHDDVRNRLKAHG